MPRDSPARRRSPSPTTSSANGWRMMAPSSSAQSSAPAILCAGIAVQDIVFRVDQFPSPGGKCMTHEFMVVLGGCAVNAAVAVARLGGRAYYAGPLGDMNDNVS